MDKVAKAIQALSLKERQVVKSIILNIKSNTLSGLDVKKLKSRDDIFRVRKGKLRIIFKKQVNGQYFILTIERRRDKGYNNFE